MSKQLFVVEVEDDDLPGDRNLPATDRLGQVLADAGIPGEIRFVRISEAYSIAGSRSIRGTRHVKIAPPAPIPPQPALVVSPVLRDYR
jgi:hypothetical protein